MGIKSTVRLTRAEAERRYVDNRMSRHRPTIEAQAAHLSNWDLETVLEAMSDEAAREQNHFVESGFDNFLIVRDEQLRDDD